MPVASEATAVWIMGLRTRWIDMEAPGMRKVITTGSAVCQVEEILVGDVDGEKVMMSVEDGQYFALEPIGSRIWELIESPTRISDIVDTLVRQYDVERAACERDVLAFLEELDGAGLLRTVS